MKVFISYAHEDFNFANKIYNDLKNHGVECWIDKENLLPGQNWKFLIKKAIKESSHFLALISSNSVTKRGYVHKELREALEILDELPESDTFIIPVRIDKSEPSHERLKELQWVDIFISYENGLDKLLKVLKPELKINPIESNKKSFFTISRIFFIAVVIILSAYLFFIQHVESKNDNVQVSQNQKNQSDYYKLGLTYFNQKDFVRAEEYLKEALKKDRNNISIINLLLDIYQSKAVTNILKYGKIEDAELSLKKAEELMGNLPDGVNLETLVLLGYAHKSLAQAYKDKNNILLSEEHWQKASKIFETILIANKNNASALNGMANVLSHEGKFRDALINYEKALELLPNYAAAANDAAITCEMLMKNEPSNKELWKNKAIEYWKKAIKLGKNDSRFPPEYESSRLNRIARLSAQ